MNTLIALCIAPCGTGDEYAADVAEIVDIIRRSGLKSRTTPCLRRLKANGTKSCPLLKKLPFISPKREFAQKSL